MIPNFDRAASRDVSRRWLLKAGGASLLIPMGGLAARAMAAPPLPEWMAAYNSGDAGAVARWAAGAISPAGLKRRNAAQWGTLFADNHRRTGDLSLVSILPQGSSSRVVLRAAKLSGQRRIDLRSDRADATRLFDLRPVDEPAPAPRPGDPPATRLALTDMLAKRFALAAARDEFSGTVQVDAPDGQAVFRFVHGWADRAAGRRMTPETPVNIGSADKSFTALIVAQLVEEGRFGFDTPLLDLLPDYPAAEAARGVTIRHLLSHSAGLGEPAGGILAYSREPYARVADLLPAVAAASPAFAPGTRFAYSNEGYVVLGAVVERVTGLSWWDALAARIYRPAAMVQSGHFTRLDVLRRCALGYYHRPDDLFQADRRVDGAAMLPWRGNSCGGGYLTIGDAMRYLAALRAGRLVSAARLAELTAKMGEPYPGFAYGLGFVLDGVGDRLLVGHSGGGSAVGIGSGMRLALANGWSFALLGNYDIQYANPLIADIGRLIAGMEA